MCAEGADWQPVYSWLNPLNIPRFVGKRLRTISFIWNRPGKLRICISPPKTAAWVFRDLSPLLDCYLQQRSARNTADFFQLRSQAMIATVVELEQQYTSSENIYSAADYVTKCGVGLCGSCAAPDGRRLCVDGPFKEEYP